jgi:prepilin-type N-terminal cleavage/methylation domain-containing protein
MSRRTMPGFTLIEIAIVLVIIGLLIGVALKGQELISSAKVKNLANDLRSIPVLFYGYQDKYRRLPGDDPAASGSRFPGFLRATASGQNPGDGLIQGLWNSTDITSENVLFWQHVRGAGFASGSTDFSSSANAALPVNAQGGLLGIQQTPPIVGLAGTFYSCSAGIQGKLAQQLDVTLDDGAPDRGSVRAQVEWNSAQPGANTYVDATVYTVCMAY